MVWYQAKKEAGEQSNNTEKVREHTLMETLSKPIKDKEVMGVFSPDLEITVQPTALYGEATGSVDEGKWVDACLSWF